MLKQLKIIFYGRVQGIGFRYTAQKIAQELKIKGYVKNLPDGSVELIAQGNESNINNLVDKLQDIFSSEIKKIESISQESTSNFQDFQIQF